MSKSRIRSNAQALAAGSPANHLAVPAKPDPSGNRAQRRAWAKRAKCKMPLAEKAGGVQEQTLDAT